MQVLNLPSASLRLRQKSNIEIFDILRKKWLVLTPEEWVRQHLVHYLLELGWKEEQMAIEKAIELNGRRVRFDLLLFKNGSPFWLIEVKAPEVKLTEEVFHQAFRYNTELNAPFCSISNGMKHIHANLTPEGPRFLSEWITPEMI